MFPPMRTPWESFHSSWRPGSATYHRVRIIQIKGLVIGCLSDGVLSPGKFPLAWPHPRHTVCSGQSRILARLQKSFPVRRLNQVGTVRRLIFTQCGQSVCATIHRLLNPHATAWPRRSPRLRDLRYVLRSPVRSSALSSANCVSVTLIRSRFSWRTRRCSRRLHAAAQPCA